MRTIRLYAAFLLLAACFAGLASLLMPTEGSALPARHATPARTAPALAAPAALAAQPAAWTPQEAGFFADLFDGQATDLAPQQAAQLLATAHRICDLGQPRADWLASMTAGPHAMSAGEASKLIDSAMGSFCPAAWTPAR